jgi:glutamate transport system substrate-binding protein
MQRRRSMRLVSLLAVIALAAVGCGGDDDSGGETGSDSGTETEAAGATETGGETDTGGETEAGGTEGGGGGEDVARIQDSGTLRVGIKYDQPLFGVNTPSGVVGFDAEIANLIAEALGGVEVEFTEAVSANREPFLQQGEVDIVAATYTINDERDEVVDFAGPYYQAGQDIMVLSGNPDGITGIDDLNTADLTTCSVDGSTSIQNFEEMAPDGETITFDTYSKCAEAMSDGRANAVTTDNVILLGLIEQSEGEFELVDNPFTEEPYGIGVPEGSDLRCFVNDVLQEAYDSGAWAEAFDSTVGAVAPSTPEPPELNTEGC